MKIQPIKQYKKPAYAIAAALLLTAGISAAGCTPDNGVTLDGETSIVDKTDVELAGEAAPPAETSVGLDGDVAIPEETDVELAGEAAPPAETSVGLDGDVAIPEETNVELDGYVAFSEESEAP